MPDHEVIVVGAGPVGLLLTCLLAQEGVDVLLCERHEGADTRSRAIGIHPPGLDALDRVGVGAAVRAEALSLEGGDVLCRGRILASLAFSPDRPVLVLPQQRTDALLRARLTELSAAAIRLGGAARAIRDEGDFVRLSVDALHRRHELTASFVVVADGVRSGLRQDLGIRWRRRPGRGSYAMLDVPDPAAGVRAQLHLEPGGVVESFPLPRGGRRWVVRESGHASPELRTADGFRRAIEERIGARVAIDDEARPVRFLAAQHLARMSARGRVALVGDAAHEVSPIGGQGMNLGWIDAERLAPAILHALAGRPDLREYARRTSRSARSAQGRSAFYMWMGAPVSGLPLVARDVLIRTLGAAPLRTWATGLITMRGL
ncbi:NAD(P)/FAD-dependent oxidoreductase [Microbacterium capsulatum]|uniref:NAD(P)/FAD-dependent oxidoreductase n=1 Tax=Microbacterium capsulatum TaxID=3041921 RepID=A0ABU0XE88_9MICO|nr:NAD(P)/FAD-dependent oxidoreductase [Microbacterium sp. ASV81]MDQ4212928.1 NAD(P)/FAD-dependent oxidoreductase [Microbacterium sp. ASV81]